MMDRYQASGHHSLHIDDNYGISIRVSEFQQVGDGRMPRGRFYHTYRTIPFADLLFE